MSSSRRMTTRSSEPERAKIGSFGAMIRMVPEQRLRHDHDRSADTMWAVGSVDVFLRFRTVLEWDATQYADWLRDTLIDQLVALLREQAAATRSWDMALPREQRGDDEVALAHVVGHLELEVDKADIVRGEHVCAVVAVARRAARCAGAPIGDRVGGEAPIGGVLGEQLLGGLEAGGRKPAPIRRSGSPARVELSITASAARAR